MTEMGGSEPFAGVIELRALVDALPFDVWARDRDQVCVYANPHALRRWPALLGSTPEVGAGRPETVAIWRANNDRAMAGEVVRGEVRYEHEGRVRTYVNYIAPVYRGDEVIGTAGVNLDVTDLREREQEVVRLEALVQGIFDNAPIAIGLRAVRDGDLVHLADNPKIAALLGRSVEELVGKTDLEIGVEAADVRRAISRFRQARAAQGSLPFEATYEAPEGPRTMVGRVAALPDAGDERYVFIGEDVTEQRALEASLLHADRLASLGTMAAGIAHEINNPLAYVQATLHFAVQQLEALQRKPEGQRDVSEALVEDLRAGLVGVERIGALVREMLSVARRPARPVAGQTADVRRTVESVLGLAASRLRPVAQVIQEIADVPPVTADALRLGQVLMNLVTNALQAFESVRRQGQIWIRARRSDDGATVLLSVEDDGPGIPAAQRGALFAPFQTGRVDGHGLGLFLCRRLVHEMGGTIVAEARPGGGTSMQVTLPVAPGAERRETSLSAGPARAGG